MFDARWSEVDAAIAQHDLLCHPFYQAWTEGTLTRPEIAAYAAQYFRHVKGFSEYLRVFAKRCGDEQIKQAVLQNLAEEQGHDKMWLDFADGMGASPAEVESAATIKEVCQLVDGFMQTAASGDVVEALAHFYAYESQVPRVAAVKNQTLKDLYAANPRSRVYFTVHSTADVEHAAVWRRLIEQVAGQDDARWQKAVAAAGQAARHLWQALDGIERERLQARAA